MDEDDDDRSGLPLLFYVVVGVLAVIGLFSISGFIFSTLFWLVRAVVIGAVALLILYVLKNMVFGRRQPSSRSDL